ncbi:cytochrome P450 [Mycena leptocephala]|nr:cytochrome P450 [Mycena leptocephala]
MNSQIFYPIALTVLFYALYHVAQLLYRELTYPLRNVAGPKSPSLIFGSFKQLKSDDNVIKQWRDEYGPTFMFRSMFSARHLHTSDVKALSHMLSNGSVYQRPPYVNKGRERLLGNGILSVEQEDHRRQASAPSSDLRRVMLTNQAFGTQQIRGLTEIFVKKAVELRDIWSSQLAQENGTPAPVDVFSWLRRMTLDVIGEAGFNYEFNSLHTKEKPNELNKAFTDLLHSPEAPRNQLFQLIQALVPILAFVPLPGSKVIANARTAMFSIAGRIVSDNIRAFEEEKSESGKNLVSVLIKANLDSNVPESQRLTHIEVVSQIPAFLVAGHETTSAATAWAMHALSLNPSVQIKLREELFTLSTDNPTMDQLNSLPYLESVVREVLRVYAPVPALERIAMQDDVLPLSRPYIDTAGNSHDTLIIPKGQIIHLPLLAVNTDKEIWGDDAAEFKPERWENVPRAASAIPSVWGNLFTFFAGQNNCIGFRFSVVETKALLFTLIRAFEVEPAVTKGGIVSSSSGLQAPMVRAEPEKGTCLPMFLKSYAAE